MVSGLNCLAVQKGTWSGKVNNKSAFFIRSLHHRCLIKCGTTKTWGN
jgi:hypothetical protein